MRITMITTSYPRWDGDYAGSFIHNIAKTMTYMDHKVNVIVPHAENLLLKECMDGVEINRYKYLPNKFEQKYGEWYSHEQNVVYKPLYQMQLSVKLAALILNGIRSSSQLITTSDVVISNWLVPGGLIGHMVSHKKNVPHIMKIYGGDISVDKNNRFLSYIRKYLLKQANCVISNSLYTASLANQYINRPIIPVYEGVDTNKFHPSVESEIIREKISGDPLIFTLGRFVPYKGIEHAINAIPFLKKEYPNLIWVFGGTGPLFSKINNLIRKLSLTDSVFLAGFIPDNILPSYYSACDIYVAPSIIDKKGNTEGLNVSVLEASSTSKPIVASNVGGLSEAVINGKTGILVPEKDPYKLSESIENIISNRKYSLRLGYNGRKRVLEKFSIDIIAKNMIAICEKCISR